MAYASGRRVDRSYDARDRLKTLRFPDRNGDQDWTYTPDGLPAQIVTYNEGNPATNTNTYTYNRRRLLTGESLTQPDWSTWTIGYGYDGNASLASLTYPSGLAVGYAPNALGQPTQVRELGGYAYADGISYYPNGAIKQFTYGNGIVHTLAQNARQLPAVSADSGGVLHHTYTYDQGGNPLSILDGVRGDHYSRWMQYDGLSRLTGVGSCSFGGDCWHRFSYDVLDNLTSWKLPGVKDNARYIYDASNRLANIKNSDGATIIGLAYDAQGNLDNKNGQDYGFDYGNRLRQVTGKEHYRYDAYGRRILSWSPATGSIALSLYSQAGQILYQSAGSDSENIYLSGSVIAIRGRTAEGGYTVKYQHTDALGSPVAVTNTAGQVIDRTDWEPYGAAINKPGYNGIGFTGHVQDAATGLSYMQQRYYDPQCGYFLSIDPVTAYGGDPRYFNRYAYAFNNPYRFNDPDGRAPSGSCNGGDGACDKPLPTEIEAVRVTASAPQPVVQNMATIAVSAPRMEPIGRPIPWGGIGAGISSTAGAVISAPFLYFFSPHPCGGRRCGELTMESRKYNPGFWSGDKGAEEWGRRNGVGAAEGRRRFHGIKQGDKGQGGGKGRDDYGTNPDTGEVQNPQGETVGDLNGG